MQVKFSQVDNNFFIMLSIDNFYQTCYNFSKLIELLKLKKGLLKNERI